MAQGRPKTGTTNGNRNGNGNGIGNRNRKNGSAQTTLDPNTNGHLEISTLETWLWDAACAIRGATDAPKFKDFILPLIFYKRLSDVFDDEFAHYVEEYEGEDIARQIIEADHRHALEGGTKPIVRFYVPHEYKWSALRNHPADGSLGEFATSAMREVARLNPDLQGVLDVKDYNERQSGQRTLDDERLGALVEILSRHRLGLENTEPDILGRAYEYLLGRFAAVSSCFLKMSATRWAPGLSIRTAPSYLAT